MLIHLILQSFKIITECTRLYFPPRRVESINSSAVAPVFYISLACNRKKRNCRHFTQMYLQLFLYISQLSFVLVLIEKVQSTPMQMFQCQFLTFSGPCAYQNRKQLIYVAEKCSTVHANNMQIRGPRRNKRCHANTNRVLNRCTGMSHCISFCIAFLRFTIVYDVSDAATFVAISTISYFADA